MTADDWSDLDELFTCPDSVTDDGLRALYEALRDRVRRETAGLDVSTGQLVQASLMLAWTVKHRSTSRHPYGDREGYQHPGQEKDAILALESVVRGFSDGIGKARDRAARDTAPRGIPVDVVQTVLADALARLDTDTRLPIISEVATALSGYGD